MSFFREDPFTGYYGSKEEDKDKEHDKLDKERKLRMKFGKSWKQHMDDTKNAQTRLRKGEVKKWDPVKKKYVSNLD
jgi:hypothetical protein